MAWPRRLGLRLAGPHSRRHRSRLITVDLDVHRLMQELAVQRPVFHSEADFQHALAWQWHRHASEHVIRLETRPFVTERFALDLAVRAGETRIAIELKHLVRALDVT